MARVHRLLRVVSMILGIEESIELLMQVYGCYGDCNCKFSVAMVI